MKELKEYNNEKAVTTGAVHTHTHTQAFIKEHI